MCECVRVTCDCVRVMCDCVRVMYDCVWVISDCVRDVWLREGYVWLREGCVIAWSVWRRIPPRVIAACTNWNHIDESKFLIGSYFSLISVDDSLRPDSEEVVQNTSTLIASFVLRSSDMPRLEWPRVLLTRSASIQRSTQQLQSLGSRRIGDSYGHFVDSKSKCPWKSCTCL